jgi:hypothetical protein
LTLKSHAAKFYRYIIILNISAPIYEGEAFLATIRQGKINDTNIFRENKKMGISLE